MTPKEKADELHKKMFSNCRIAMAGAYVIFNGLAKKLAIVCVDEIIKSWEKHGDEILDEFPLAFYRKVKSEIEKL